jgi:hypothetical protein
MGYPLSIKTKMQPFSVKILNIRAALPLNGEGADIVTYFSCSLYWSAWMLTILVFEISFSIESLDATNENGRE